jgi:hypothetical protein
MLQFALPAPGNNSRNPVVWSGGQDESCDPFAHPKVGIGQLRTSMTLYLTAARMRGRCGVVRRRQSNIDTRSGSCVATTRNSGGFAGVEVPPKYSPEDMDLLIMCTGPQSHVRLVLNCKPT